MSSFITSTAVAALSLNQIVDAFNAAQELLGRDSGVKKFSDKKTGLARLEKAQAELVAMHGQAELVSDEKGVRWDVESRAARAEARTLSTLNLSAALTILSEQNPKRPNSRSREIFDLYTGCKTGEDYVAAMVKAGHPRKLALSALHWDTAHGFVKLG